MTAGATPEQRLISPTILPSPLEVVGSFKQLWFERALTRNLAVSFRRVVVGFAAALISAVLGSIVGLAGGYFGGWVDRVLDAFENWFLVIPTLPLMIVLARVLSPSLIVLIAVIGLPPIRGTASPTAQATAARARKRVEPVSSSPAW